MQYIKMTLVSSEKTMKKEIAKQTLSVNRLQLENQVTTRSKSKMFKKREFDMGDDIDTDKPSVRNLQLMKNNLSKKELFDRCYP